MAIEAIMAKTLWTSADYIVYLVKSFCQLVVAEHDTLSIWLLTPCGGRFHPLIWLLS